MKVLSTPLPNLKLVDPDPIHHAPLTLGWFTSEYGRETLLLMGNAEHEIRAPSLESEQKILQEFMEMNNQKKQLSWMIEYGSTIIGVAWIELTENHTVKAPSVHLVIGAIEYRGKGIGKATMETLIEYITTVLKFPVIYSRHLASNVVVASMNKSLGFIDNGSPYVDENELVWQNTKRV